MEQIQGDELLIGGVGGWGIITMGDILAKASLHEYEHIAWFPCYATMMRGGESECCVIYSKKSIPSPIIYKSRTAMVLGAWRVKAFEDRVRSGGLMIIEASGGGDQQKISRDDIDIKYIKALETATKLGDMRNANLVMLGAYVGIRKPVTSQFVLDEIEQRFGKGGLGQEKVKAGKRAFSEGMSLVAL